VANDEIHFAREVAKTNTTQLGTFHSGHRGLAGLVNAGRAHFYAPPVRRHTARANLCCRLPAVRCRASISFSPTPAWIAC